MPVHYGSGPDLANVGESPRSRRSRGSPSARLVLQHDADTGDGMQQSRAIGLVLYLASETIDRDAHHVRRTGIVVSPDLPQDRSGGDQGADIDHQVLEQTKLGDGQVERAAGGWAPPAHCA